LRPFGSKSKSYLVIAYGLLGQQGEAAQALRDAGLQVLKADPPMDPIGAELRFRDVIKALKFSD
jgi:hypothetical protein